MNKSLVATIAACCSIAALAGPALAGDHDHFNWSGFYFGGSIGGAWGDAKAVDVKAPLGGFWTPAGQGFGFSFSDSDWTGGGHVGIQHQFGSLVVGVEGGLDYQALEQRIVSPYFPATDSEKMKIGSIWSVAGRLGFAHDRWMAYAKGGWAGANVEFQASDVFSNAYSQKNWHNGYVVGGGAEYALTDVIRLGVDYSYFDLGSATSGGVTGGPIGTITERFKVDANVQNVTFRINFLMGRHEESSSLK